jgi:hypothetical protein
MEEKNYVLESRVQIAMDAVFELAEELHRSGHENLRRELIRIVYTSLENFCEEYIIPLYN